jgi:hypothetical protein
MVTWFKYKHEGEVEFNYFDLRDDPKNKEIKTIKVTNTGGQAYGINNFSLSLASIW